MKKLALIATPILALLFGLFLFYIVGIAMHAAIAASVALWCALWWVFEPIPVPVTSLLPLAVFPLTGVLNASQVASAYGHPLILLLMGGFVLSKAMEASDSHRQIALGIVKIVGHDHPRRLVLGFMLASALLSMWISNTATTLMLLPVALAALGPSRDTPLAPVLFLSIAYAASLGGIGTPIGTPPNLVFMEFYRQATNHEPDFIEWMSWAMPVVVIFFPLMYFYLTKGLKQVHIQAPESPGPWTVHQKRVMYVFVLTALAWMTRKAPFGGWSHWLDLKTANDAAVALTAVIVLFVVSDGNKRNGKLLSWNKAREIPWGVLLLFAGGIALAKGFTSTGLSDQIGHSVAGLSHLPVLLIILGIALVVTFLTEMTSNTATTTLLMPVLATAAINANLDPALLMLPAVLSASCAFMLPVATAPNAIVYGTGYISTRKMAKTGFLLNIMGALVITAVVYWLQG